MAKISSARSFQYKIVKHVVLSILIPGAIIFFSWWFFFGEKEKPAPTTAPTKASTNAPVKIDPCKEMTKDNCKPDKCTWDTKQNKCLASK